MQRARQLLFRPFDFGKWLAIGFCVWLATLGERGFVSSFNSGSGSNHPGGDIHQQFDHAHDFVLRNLYWILPVAIVAIVSVMALWMLFVWLSSRGKFMFLSCVALDRAEVREPWNRFAGAGNSLFRFRLVLGLIGLALTLPLLVLMGLSALPMFLHDTWNLAGIMALVGLGLGMVVVGIVFGLIRMLTMDFVVPIMFLRGTPCLGAWKEFRQLLGANLSEFVLYLLFQIVIGLGVGMVVLLVVVITCCLAGCLLAIPYLGTVLFLPVLVFKRAYSLYYFAQYGPAYDVFPPAAKV